jgi:3-oxoacyl-[acyl-carrier-protein] synthase-3
MQGNAVFRWASYEMAKVARQALEAAGVTADDLDVFVPHQANDRITTAMARSLKLPDRVVIARDIVEQGNTSAASIPLALERLLETGEARSGQLALLIGFGAGLVYGAQVVRIP